MTKVTHNKIIKILYELCMNFTYYKEVHADHINSAGYKPIDIVSPHGKGKEGELYYFIPDLWAKIKSNNNVDVYEVWDEQSKASRLEDVILSALTPNIYTLSIICLDQDTAENARKIVKVVLNSIYNEKRKKLLDPTNVLPYIVIIPDKIQRSELETKKLLKTVLNL